jgi:hypothetical protein
MSTLNQRRMERIKSAINGRIRRCANDGNDRDLESYMAMAAIVGSPESDAVKTMGLMEQLHRKWSSQDAGFADDFGD